MVDVISSFEQAQHEKRELERLAALRAANAPKRAEPAATSADLVRVVRAEIKQALDAVLESQREYVFDVIVDMVGGLLRDADRSREAELAEIRRELDLMRKDIAYRQLGEAERRQGVDAGSDDSPLARRRAVN